MRHILVATSEPSTRLTLISAFEARNYRVASVADGAAAVETASRSAIDAVLLDLALPDVNGVELTRALRERISRPIIALSGASEPAEKVAVLDAGADDHVTKPFDVEELCARLRAVLRRPPAFDEPGPIEVGDWQIDLAAYAAVHRHQAREPLHLTPTEWRLLTTLLRNPGRLVTRNKLLREAWGPTAEQKTNYLRVYLSGLRRKLESDPGNPRHLITEPGLGYRFDP